MSTILAPTIQDYSKAHDYIDELQKNNEELKEIMTAIQPLLYELSVALYKDDDSTVSIAKLIEDGTKWIKGKNNG